MRTWVALMIAATMAGCGDKQCDVSGHACTWAGQAGVVGFNGDGHDRLQSKLYWTMDILFASDGTPWFIDWNNHLVRKVLPDGTLKSMVGWTDPVFPGDGESAKAELTDQGAMGSDVQLNHPTDMVENPDGTILLMAWHNHKLRHVDPATDRVQIMCGSGAGFAGDGGGLKGVLFKQPSAVERDDQGNIYIIDQQNFRIRKIDAGGMVSTIAGTAMQKYAGDGGPANMASFNFEAGSNPEPSGGLTYRDGKLYISETLSHRIRVIDFATGLINTIAGTGEGGYNGDNIAATDAQLNKPHDLEFGPEGDLYVADTDNGRIRAINLSTGIIRTVAGAGGEPGLDPTDDRLATATKLARPFGIGFDKPGNLYIADTINSRIVRVAK